MNIEDYFTGTVDVARPLNVDGNNQLSSELLVLPTRPAPGGVPAGVVATSYEIFQLAAGNGVAILFYDRAILPPDGSTLVGNSDPSLDVVWAVPLTAPGVFTYNVSGPGHRYVRALGLIVSSSLSTVVRATDNCIIAVHNIPYFVA